MSVMKPFFIEIQNLGRQIGQINSGAFWVFSAKLSAFWYSESLVHVFHSLFLRKTKPLYPHPKHQMREKVFSTYVNIWNEFSLIWFFYG